MKIKLSVVGVPDTAPRLAWLGGGLLLLGGDVQEGFVPRAAQVLETSSPPPVSYSPSIPVLAAHRHRKRTSVASPAWPNHGTAPSGLLGRRALAGHQTAQDAAGAL
jgi:hypothetical protein